MKKMVAAITVNSIIVSSMVATYAFASGPYTIHQERELGCHALNIYFETRASSLADAMAVADVVQNRVNHTSFPNNVCDVVKQSKLDSNGDPIKNKCQFSWYCDGKNDTPKNSDAWEKSRKYARDFYVHGSYVGITEGATHYHADYVKPYWSKKLDRITKIGSHIFYRMKGK